MADGTDPFTPVGKTIAAVVVKLADRRDQARISRVTKKMFNSDSVRQLNELERANGHLIAAWKIYVAECATTEDSRAKISAALLELMLRPVTKQE